MRAFQNNAAPTISILLKYVIGVLIIITLILMMTITGYAMNVGTEIGEVLSTDIIAVIDNQSIPSLNINGYTAVVVEDLRSYGFSVHWNEQERMLHVNRNTSLSISGKPFEAIEGPPGKRLYPVLFTDIRTYLDGTEVVSFNIDGQTAIYFNQLKNYGTISWNDQARIAALELIRIEPEEPEIKEVVEAEPLAPVTRHTTQLDPEESDAYHRPYNKTDAPQYIDVGLHFGETAVARIPISTGDGFVIGEFIGERFDPSIKIQDTNQLQLERDDDYYIGTNGWVKSLDEAQSLLQQLRSDGIVGLLAKDDQAWGIFVGPYRSISEAERDMINFEFDSSLWRVVSADSRRVRINSGSGSPIIVFTSNTPLYIASESGTPADSVIQIGQAKYRGTVTAVRKSHENLTVINRLPLEKYLYGVVPREMPHSWNKEALKAQAVAARGFALANIGKYQEQGFDVCATVNSQVYGGFASEQTNTNQAVDQTTGMVMTYRGELVIPYYHSNSGGRTESSENVWREAVPYARGVEDPFSLNQPHSDWAVTLSFSEIEQSLARYQINVGSLENMRIDEITENGRVGKMTIVGSHGTHELQKQDNRWVFGLKSHYFDMWINDQTITFTGKGYGHGVGMSQYGAQTMAEAGYSWQQILQYYYSGVRIE